MSAEIPFFAAERTWAARGERYAALIADALSSGRSLQGPAVAAFEAALAEHCERRHAVAVGSGTDALFFALIAAGVGPGEEVVVPAISFIASASCVLRAGAVPVFADVDAHLMLDPHAARAALSPRARAILAVDLFGQVVDAAALQAVADEHELALVEDAAQALGASTSDLPRAPGGATGPLSPHAPDAATAPLEPRAPDAATAPLEPRAPDGATETLGPHAPDGATEPLGAPATVRRAGSIGLVSCCSFDPTKTVAAPGSGGAVLTDDDELAAHVRRLRWHGRDERGRHAHLGYNSQLPTASAAVLLDKLDNDDGAWTRRRQAIAARYDAALDGSPHRPVGVAPGRTHVFHKYAVRSPARDALRDHLRSHGVTTLVHYAAPLARQPMFDGRCRETPCPNAERACAELLSLPIHAQLTDAEVDRVCAALRDATALSEPP